MHAQREVCDLDRRIYLVLRFLGVPVRILGYRYMAEAIRIILTDEDAGYAITKRVYMTIAKMYGTTEVQVESAIRTAIRHVWGFGRCDRVEQIFGYSQNEKGRPCNSEFLNGVSEYLRYYE